MLEDLDSPIERAEYLQNMLIADATGGGADNEHYKILRNEFVSVQATKEVLPGFVRTNRDLSQFWAFIKHKFSTYAERRAFIYQEFVPLFEFLEGKNSAPSDSSISDVLRNFDAEGVHSVWAKALERRKTDPEGAITAARTLLETVCKHILDTRGIQYSKKKNRTS